MSYARAIRSTASLLSALAPAALLALGMAFAPGAMADWYFGVKTGPMRLDQSGSSDPTNAGLVLGHEWGVVAGDLGLQAEATRTVDSGRFNGQDVDLSTQALYGVFRTAGPVYLIGKAGLVHERVEIGGASSSDSGSSVGAGVGISLGIAQIELEYTRIDENVDHVTLGVRF